MVGVAAITPLQAIAGEKELILLFCGRIEIEPREKTQCVSFAFF